MPQPDVGPTLTNMTAMGRQAVKFTIIGIVVLIVGRTLLTAAINFWKAVNPPKPPAPTMGFGQLPLIPFPNQTADDKPKSYQLEIPGRLPYFGDRAKVFLMPKSTLTLLSDETVRKIAASYNFVFAPETVGGNLYRWTKTKPLSSTLEINADTMTFSLDTDFLSRAELVSAQNKVPDEKQATARVKAFLSTSGLLPKDVATVSAKITYLKALGSDLQPAVSLSDADLVQVDLDRYPIDGKYYGYGPDGLKSSIHAIVTGALSGNESVVRMEYNYFGIDGLQMHTYPLRSTQSAWQLLQGGEGYIANKGTDETAVVRDVTLGYFEAFAPQEYYQPIYVFTGDNGFIGYISALDPKARVNTR